MRSQLRRLSFPESPEDLGSEVRIRNRTAWAEGAYRKGHLFKMIGELEGQTRIARGPCGNFRGSQAEMRESTKVFRGGFTLAMAVICGLLAVAFGSYLQPLIVMTAIPFGIVGAVIVHILLGYDLSLISLMGVIALSGVVVNDSLIMVDFANRKRAGLSAFEAIHQAGLRRIRPIILTTLTTAGGLTPIILETPQQAHYLIPMAISLGFGIVFATAIILVIVSCLYLILEDVISLGHESCRSKAGRLICWNYEKPTAARHPRQTF